MQMEVIVISNIVMNIIKKLCNKVGVEWYAFPLGRFLTKGEDNIFVIEDLYIPMQMATLTHVKIPADINIEIMDKLEEVRKIYRDVGLLGMLHSHGNLGVFHSGEDLKNIEVIFECFSTYLPSRYATENMLGLFPSEVVEVAPLIRNNAFKGVKISFGASVIEIDFGGSIENADFFVRWYKYFYDIKCLFEVLRSYYKTRPVIKNITKNKVYYVPSVVVNNRGEIVGEIFIFETRLDEIKRSTAKAKILIKESSRKPYYLYRESVDDIVKRIKGSDIAGQQAYL